MLSGMSPGGRFSFAGFAPDFVVDVLDGVAAVEVFEDVAAEVVEELELELELDPQPAATSTVTASSPARIRAGMPRT
jgi:hypothetical protein